MSTSNNCTPKIVVQPDCTTVKICSVGIPGATGAQGPQGPQGPAGTVETGSFLYSGSYNPTTNIITLYSEDANYSLDLSDLVDTDSIDYVSNVTFDGVTLDFTGTGNATSADLNISSVTGSSLQPSDTGSFMVTGSVVSNVITFEKGDGTTFSLTVDTGSASGGDQDLQSVLSIGNYASGSIILQNGGAGGNGLYFRTHPGISNRSASFSLLNDGHLDFALGSVVYQRTWKNRGTEVLQQFTASNSVSFPNIANTDRSYVLGYDDTTGDVTYFSTSSLGGGSTDYISNVAYSNGSVTFTGVGNAFDGSVNINGLTASLVQNSQTSSFVTNDDTGSFLYSGSYNSGTNTVTLYSVDQDYDLDLSDLAGGGVTVPGNNREVIFNDNGNLGASGSFIFTDSAANHRQFTVDATVDGASNSLGYIKASGSLYASVLLNEFSIVRDTLANEIRMPGVTSNNRNTFSIKPTGTNENGRFAFNDKWRDSSILHVRNQSTDVNAYTFATYNNAGVSTLGNISFAVSSSGHILAPQLKNTTNSNYLHYNSTTGEITYNSGAPSDERLKDNITPLTGSLEKLSQVDAYEFDWNDNSPFTGHDIGVIAQEIEAIHPELVDTQEDGYKVVKYDKLSTFLLSVVKAQQTQIEDLQSRVSNLEG